MEEIVFNLVDSGALEIILIAVGAPIGAAGVAAYRKLRKNKLSQ